jgi:DNA-binding NarL/FixJ family response regulator
MIPTRRNVLICDDDPMIRAALADLLRIELAVEDITLAADADEAIELAQRLAPSVAVLDCRMPGGGGGRAAREIRLRSPHTKILAFSAQSDVHSRTEMRIAGATEYVTKGTTNAEIVDAVRRLLPAQP